MNGPDRRTLLTGLATGAVGAGTAFIGQQGSAHVIDTASQRPALTPYQFGAVGDGVADDGVALANWLRAGATGASLRLPSGTYRSSLPLEIQLGGKGHGLVIRGDGAANTGVLADGPIDRPALRIVGNMPEFDHLHVSGFRIERRDRGAEGFGDGQGLLVENVRQFAIEDIRTFRNGCGLHLIGCLVGRIINVLSYYDRQGMVLEQGGHLSSPNVITIDGCSILAALKIGVDLSAGTCVTLRSTTIEATGIEAPDKRATGLLIRNSGLAGGVAIDASALYFEDNHGSDVKIDHPDRLLTYGFSRCVFNRFTKSATAPSVLFGSRNAPHGAPAVLDVSGSTFLGHGSDYRASPTRPAIGFDFPAGFAGVRLIESGTLYQFEEERPSVQSVHADLLL